MLLGETRKLEIITENCHEAEYDYKNSHIKYPLYEANYISGIRMIFQQAIEYKECPCDKNKNFLLEEKRNILSFVGDRGAGKTTAMDDFCHILSNMGDEKCKEWWLKHTLNETEQSMIRNIKFCFHILRPIDGSLLSEKEDLFELILSNLYYEFQDKIKQGVSGSFTDNFKIRDIMGEFNEILSLYRNMMSHQTEDIGTGYLTQLQMMASSQVIQEKVDKLIEDLLALDGTSICRREYIVIAIDDVDLNLQHGYEMLEQLQKYFSSRRIIVLLAIDYKQMRMVCEEHFIKEMPKTSALYKKEEHNRKLADDYMIKIFHLSQRMYMPDIHRISKKSYVKYTDKNDVIKMIPVKRFVQSKIAEIMRVYYDARGLKEHFSEPETIRNLVSYNEFLESLDEIKFDEFVGRQDITDEQKKHNLELLKKYDQNHEHFNEDINVRMVNKLLTYEQKMAFDKLKQQDLARRAKYFVHARRENGQIIFKHVNDKRYSYGQLLQHIYEWGRMDGVDYFEDKPFIRCVLASFTSEMVCEYMKYRYNFEKRSKYKERLAGFMGETFGNEWVGRMFPEITPRILSNVYGDGKNEKKIIGFMQDISAWRLNVDIDISELKKRKEYTSGYLKTMVKSWLENEKVIETVECIDMFFIRKDNNDYKGIVFSFGLWPVGTENNKQEELESQKKEVEQKMRITGGEEKVYLDVMAFVPKSLNYLEVKNTLHENIILGLEGFIGKYLCISSDIEKMDVVKESIQEQINKVSMFAELNESSDYDVAFPFYNLDMSYNIMKRVKNEFKEKVIEEKDIVTELIRFYEYIGKLLKEESTEYIEEAQFKYGDIFENSPYIEAFGEWKDTKKIYARLQTAFHQMGLKDEGTNATD